MAVTFIMTKPRLYSSVVVLCCVILTATFSTAYADSLSDCAEIKMEHFDGTRYTVVLYNKHADKKVQVTIRDEWSTPDGLHHTFDRGYNLAPGERKEIAFTSPGSNIGETWKVVGCEAQ
jgi:hypothetical protein